MKRGEGMRLAFVAAVTILATVLLLQLINCGVMFQVTTRGAPF